jgi:hypothetical protein
MGNRLFGVDIAAILKQSLASGLLPVKLIKEIPGARGADLTDGQVLTPRSYNCRGFTEEYKLREIDGTNVQRGDKKVLILGDTLPSGIVPQLNDRIECERIIYTISGVPSRDPAAATYVCQVRGG